MAKRSEISVILLSNQSILRADFGKDLTVPAFKKLESVDVESTISASLDQVIDNQLPIGHRAVIVWTDVWSQLVSLPRLSISGIESDELEEVLKFEAETLSGIEVDEIALASNPMGTEDEFQQYWVSAIRRSDLNSILEQLEEAGCREIVVAHPAGLSGNQDWAKDNVEVWQDLAFFLSGFPGKLSKVKQASLEQLAGKSSVLLGSQVLDYQPAAEAEVRNLSDESCLDQWAAQVAYNYLKNAEHLAAPIIRSHKRTGTTPIRPLISATIALLVFGFCFWHWNYLNSGNLGLQKRIEEVQKPAAEKKKYDTQLMAILADRSKVDTEDAALARDLKRVQFFLEHQNNRFAQLLSLLADLRTPELVIQQIGGTEAGVSISGVSLNGESAQALAKRLREHAAPLGWVVNAARQDGQQKLTTGGPWDFEIQLTDTGPFESTAKLRQKASSVSGAKSLSQRMKSEIF